MPNNSHSDIDNDPVAATKKAAATAIVGTKDARYAKNANTENHSDNHNITGCDRAVHNHNDNDKIRLGA